MNDFNAWLCCVIVFYAGRQKGHLYERHCIITDVWVDRQVLLSAWLVAAIGKSTGLDWSLFGKHFGGNAQLFEVCFSKSCFICFAILFVV